ncbi:MAG: hypothetical protein HYZ28_02520 [Myxococcales bacterium]|nr:hypothetical protein [Myxococcales bacterium]
MRLPRYFIVGDRPVKAVLTADGGMDVLAFDWGSGEMVREMGYLTRIMTSDPEVDEVSREEFDEKVRELTGRLRK